MKITLLYFARIRETLNYSSEDVELPSSVKTVAELRQWLSLRGGAWKQAFSGDDVVRAAINHALVDEQAEIIEGAEVAFFPPVTGG